MRHQVPAEGGYAGPDWGESKRQLLYSYCAITLQCVCGGMYLACYSNVEMGGNIFCLKRGCALNYLPALRMSSSVLRSLDVIFCRGAVVAGHADRRSSRAEE